MPANVDIGDNYELDEDSNGDLVIKDATDTVVAKHTDGGGWDISDITTLSGESTTGVYDDSTQTVGDGTTSADHESVNTEQAVIANRLSTGDYTSETISSNSVTANSVYFGVGNSNATATLETINGAEVGDIIVLRRIDATDVTIAHGVGNIYLDGATDVVLDNFRDRLWLHAVEDGSWTELSHTDAG